MGECLDSVFTLAKGFALQQISEKPHLHTDVQVSHGKYGSRHPLYAILHFIALRPYCF
jgi:hypothetical protein